MTIIFGSSIKLRLPFFIQCLNKDLRTAVFDQFFFILLNVIIAFDAHSCDIFEPLEKLIILIQNLPLTYKVKP